MGLMSAITIALALGMDFFLLPTLLMKVDKKNINSLVSAQPVILLPQRHRDAEEE